ncbi:MAG TPA: hypothetical protein VGL09_09270 [Methylomirabilota bacterium]|jgi:hypothetical protein
MHIVIATGLALLLALLPVVVAAEDAEALRRELEQMRKDFERMQQQYQKSIESLTDRLKRLETRPTSPPAPAPPGAGVTAPAPGVAAPLTPLDLARPREPFSLYERRGAGQLLFDMGVTGDFVANLTQRNVDKANAGTFAGRENRFFPREIELNLFGQIDPYARAEVRIEAGEEAPGAETGVTLAEATITLLSLPWGFQAKLGQMRTRFGLTNVIHEHDLPFVDRPDVLRMFFGEEGLTEKGVEITWVPPLPFYLEVLGGIFNGDNEAAFGRGKLTEPLITGRVRTFFEITDTSAIQLGLSVANGRTEARLNSTLVGYDVKYKYRPDGWLHPLLTLSSEGIWSIRRVEVTQDVDVPIDTDGDGIPDDVGTMTTFGKRTRDRFGWYAHAELQPFRRWAFGARFDSTQYLENPGRQWAIEPYVSFFPSEFLRFRLAYKHTERTHRFGFTDNGGSAGIMDEIFLQATFVLGAHPAHPF